MRALLILLSWLPMAAAAEPAAHFAPQAFLAGHCWKGTFPDGKRTDLHCYEWVYDGAFLREQTYRSQWRRDGDDAYFAITEIKDGDAWKEAWRLTMQRQK